ASDVDTIKMIRSKVIPAPSSLCPDLSPEIDAVILKALERDPMKRYPTARAFGEAIEAACSNAKALAPHGAVEEHMRLLFLDPLSKRRAAIKALQAAPPQRPVSVSEVEAAEKVGGSNTPATRLPMKPSLKIALQEKPQSVLLPEDASPTGSSFEMPPRPGVPRKVVAASTAALAVIVVALAGLGVLAKKPAVAAAAGAPEEPPVVVTVSRAPAPHDDGTRPAANSIPSSTPEETSSARKAAKPAPSARPRVAAAATPAATTKPETAAPPIAIQEPSKPSTVSTPAVPKNPYAP
ncbi:MAG TPA: hypothetical protein VF407_05535, partial [Polyangiaceae bacterium]